MVERHYKYRRFLDFPESEYEARYQKIQVEMADLGMDAILLTTEPNIRYFTGFKTSIFKLKLRPLFAILRADSRLKPILVLPEFLEAAALATSWVDDVRITSECYGKPNQDAIEVVTGVLTDVGLDKVTLGMEFGVSQHLGMSQTEFTRFKTALPKINLVDASGPIWKLRRLKSPLEIETMKTACDISAAGVLAGFQVLRPGLTEAELYARIVSTYYQEGAEGHLLGIHSTAKGNQVRDTLPCDFPFERGHFMKIDGGAMVKGYYCDFCRLLSVGPAIEPRRRAMQTSIDAFRAVADRVRPGVRISELGAAADRLLAERGYSCYWNAIGHGLGMELHEPPILYRDNYDPLEVGNVLSVEVGVVDPDRFDDASFTFEENLAVTEDGYRWLTDKLPPQIMETE
jgi:Xaa-Pro dipeptidase